MSGMYRRSTMPALCLGLLLAGCGDRQQSLQPHAQAKQLAGTDPERGRQLVASYGCVSCHTIPGVAGPASNVGPPLEKLALRAYLGGVVPNTPDDLVRWLLDPPVIDPRTAMPNMGLSEREARDVAAYLYTLD